MSETEHASTRERILKVASKLFGGRGYGSTSVRDIAQEAQVNIASLNYHFKSKQDLLWEIIDGADKHMCAIAEEAAQRTDQFEEACVQLCDKMMEISEEVRAVMRVFISEVDESYKDHFRELCDDGAVGPPGTEALAKVLEKSVKRKLSQDEKIWAVRSMFMMILMWTMMSNSPFHKIKIETDAKYFSKKSILKDVRALAASLVQTLESNAPKIKY